MPRHSSLALIIAAAAVSSCGGGVDRGSIVAAYAQAQCASLYACCGSEQKPSMASCEQSETTLYLAALAALAADAKVDYDSGKGQACVDALQALSCDSLVDSDTAPVPCQTMFSGTVALGGACIAGEECASGFCTGITFSGTTATAPGTCAAPGAIGQACAGAGSGSSGMDCASGAYDLEASGGVCTCAALLADGASCEVGSQCVSTYCANEDTNGACAEIPVTTSLASSSCATLIGLLQPPN